MTTDALVKRDREVEADPGHKAQKAVAEQTAGPTLAPVQKPEAVELTDEHYFLEHTCKANCIKMLTKVKGMSEKDAKAFIGQHLELECEHTNRECYNEPGCLRTLKQHVVFKNTAPAKGKKAAVDSTVACTYNYHHRPRKSFSEHYVKLSFSVDGSDAASGMIFESDVDSKKKKNKFKLTKKSARAIQSAFPAGWSSLQAMLLLYAALGVEWSDEHVRMKSPASKPYVGYDDSSIEGGTFKACGYKP